MNKKVPSLDGTSRLGDVLKHGADNLMITKHEAKSNCDRISEYEDGVASFDSPDFEKREADFQSGCREAAKLVRGLLQEIDEAVEQAWAGRVDGKRRLDQSKIDYFRGLHHTLYMVHEGWAESSKQVISDQELPPYE